MSVEPESERDLSGPDSPHFTYSDPQDSLIPSELRAPSGQDADVAGWEEVAAGRFMPRRVRGSCYGRALG